MTQDQEAKSYWVVEYRFPVLVQEADDAKEAHNLSAAKLKEQFGINASGWFARIFEYGPSTDVVGPLTEYFFNPSGSHYRAIDKNDEEHGRLYHENLEKENPNNG